MLLSKAKKLKNLKKKKRWRNYSAVLILDPYGGFLQSAMGTRRRSIYDARRKSGKVSQKRLNLSWDLKDNFLSNLLRLGWMNLGTVL